MSQELNALPCDCGVAFTNWRALRSHGRRCSRRRASAQGREADAARSEHSCPVVSRDCPPESVPSDITASAQHAGRTTRVALPAVARFERNLCDPVAGPLTQLLSDDGLSRSDATAAYLRFRQVLESAREQRMSVSELLQRVPRSARSYQRTQHHACGELLQRDLCHQSVEVPVLGSVQFT